MLEEYYRKNIDRHVNIIKKRLKGNTDLAWDIVNEAFLRACVGIKHFDPEKGNFGKWFSKILYRSYLDHINHEYRRMEDINLAIALEDWVDYELIYENSEVIDKALKDLDGKYHTAVRLFYKEGYNVDQIHKITKLSETHIRQLCFRFKNTLKDKWSLEL